MSRVHFFLQGKGGSGKSTIASYLAQYFLDKNNENQKVIVIDTDPVNHTLSGFKRFNTIVIDILKDSNINPLKFDEIIQIILEAEDNTDIIIDNGASSFIPFVSYIIDNGVPELLKENGHTLKIHTVIVGQDAFVDTMQGFKGLAQSFKNDALYVWLNPFFGEVVSSHGKNFFEMNTYIENQERVRVIELPRFNQDTFGVDIALVRKEKKTFEEVISDQNFFIMTRQRIKIARNRIYSAIDLAADLQFSETEE